MKRQDVEIGVEYAATGALAYGHEPDRKSPRRVRFTDTRPGPWWRIITSRFTEGAGALGGNAWKTADIQIIHGKSAEGRQAEANLPASFVRARPDAPEIGAECTYLDTGIKGGLPGEVYREGAWITTLVVPAEIHRTWDVVQAEQVKRATAMADLDMKSRATEINRLLSAVGLGGIIEARRIGGDARVDFASRGSGRDGELILQMLTEWAKDRRPGGWGEAIGS